MGERADRAPELGWVLSRTRLLSTFEQHGLDTTIMRAPSGYGKTVLAAQCARLPVFDKALWVSMHDSDASALSLPAYLGAVLLCADGDLGFGVGGHSGLTAPTATDHIMSVRELLAAYQGETIIVVFDGVNTLSDPGAVHDITQVLQECTSPRSRLVVTCRRIERDEHHHPSKVWVLEPEDLCFSLYEVEQLIEQYMPETGDRPEADVLLARFGGQTALTVLTLRHTGVDFEGGRSQDLIWYAERTVDAISAEMLTCLYAAAVMKDGSVADLNALAVDLHGPVDWRELVSVTPLFAVKSVEMGGRAGFQVHAALAEAARRLAQTRLGVDSLCDVRRHVFAHLELSQRYGALLSSLQDDATPDEVQGWLERVGEAMLRAAGPTAVEQCMERVSPSVVAMSWRLLLLRAAIFRQQENTRDAMQHAQIAKRIAEIDDDRAGAVACSLMVSRLALDACEFGLVRTVLAPLEARASRRLPVESECLVQSYLAVAESQTGHPVAAQRRIQQVREMLSQIDADGEEAALAANAVATVEGVCGGQWSDVAVLLSPIGCQAQVTPVQRLTVRANYAMAAMETGRIREAINTLVVVLAEVEANRLESQRAYALGTTSAAYFAMGHVELAREYFDQCDYLHAQLGDSYGYAAELAAASAGLRASRLTDDALTLVERAHALVIRNISDRSFLLVFVRAELAASLLATGDVMAGVRLAEATRSAMDGLPMTMHLLRLDLVLSEAARQSGDYSGAMRRLESYRPYILTGSANTMLSLYIRAFPGLLGVLCSFIDPRELPVHMLRLLPVSIVEEAIMLASDVADPARLLRLRDRLDQCLPDPGMGYEEPIQQPRSTCRVRLFGGLEVVTDYGVVDDAAWRKRKSRLLFISLVLRRGQVIPRDVLLERFWPDMDEERACRNFHVTWNTMKKALVANGKPSLGEVYVRSSGGSCWALESVTSDLDVFDEAMERLRSAIASASHNAAIEAAREVADVYRGDLLPGDLYEESFTAHRERYKSEFCDGMVDAATVAEENGDPATALRFLRRVIAIDPWREDVHQAMMRCLTASGQRSRAIETYLYCRSRLVDDLGIDPSAETVRLYQAILAMDGGSAEFGSWPAIG